MIIAFVGQKGGAGKTTTALCLAAEWHARGRRVLVVDADPQGTARTWASVASEAGRSPPAVVAMGAEMHQGEQLPRLAQGHDVTVIDCPGRISEVQRSALMIAQLAILPCGPTPADVWALQPSIDVVNEARALRPELLAAVLITKQVGRSALAGRARAAIAEGGLPILNAALGFRVAYQEAPGAGLAPTTYQPRGAAAHEVRALADELEMLLAAHDRVGPEPAQEVLYRAV